MSEKKESVLGAAGAMGSATMISRVLGLVREQVFAFFFGAGHATDAFNIAYRIPNLLRDLFAEGAMSAALVPVFVRVRDQEGQKRAWRVAGLVFRVLFFTVAVIVLVGIVFSPELVNLYASAYREIPGKFELTVRMTRIMFPFFPLVVLAAAFMAVLNACGKFFIPAFSSALFNLVSVVVGVTCSFFAPRLGYEPIEGMAVGVVVGGAVQAFAQLPLLYSKGYRWPGKSPSDPAWHQDPALRRMMMMMVPGTIGLAATQINLLVNSILATSQGAGAVSWLGYAFRLMHFPIGIFGVSMAAATLPRVSALWVKKDVSGVTELLTRSLRQVFAVNFPASAGLIALGVPIIGVIYEHGRFAASDTQATALALTGYAAGLVAYSSVKVLVPASYALGNARLPVLSSLVSVGSNIAFNLALIGPLGFWGLALGTSLSAVVNLLFLYFGVRYLLGRSGTTFSMGPLLRSGIIHLGISGSMGWICYQTWIFLEERIPVQGFWVDLGVLALLIFQGVAFVAIAGRVLGNVEIREGLDFFLSKIKKLLFRAKS